MSKFAKPIEQLLNAPPEVYRTMEDFADYHDIIGELRADIADRFNYPSLWAAIDRLTDFAEKYALADMAMSQAGFTSDDSFALAKHQKKEAPCTSAWTA